MHNQLHAFTGGIGIQRFYIKIGIRSDKIENFFFPVACPVFPAYIPTFYKDSCKTMFGCKINITTNIFITGTVLRQWCKRIPIGVVQFNIGSIGIIPRHCIGHMHSPPDTNVFLRLNETWIGNFTGFVQVQNHFRCQYVCCLITYNNCAPWGVLWRLHIGFCAHGIRSKCSSEYQIFFVDEQMHGRIIDKCRFKYIDVQFVICFQHEWCLNCIFCKITMCAYPFTIHLRSIYFRKFCGAVIILVSVVIAGNPKCFVIVGKCEFGFFVGDSEIIQISLFVELISESQSIVEQTESDFHGSLFLFLLEYNQ